MIYYLLICRDCPDPLPPIPFASAAERGHWAAEHTKGTGHDRWIVLDFEPPDERADCGIEAIA